MNWMKATGFQVALIALLGFGLTASAVVCHLWMLWAAQDHMPRSHESSSPEPCPPSICQASSSYLVSNLGGTTLSPLVELDTVPIESTISGNSLAVAAASQTNGDSPPGATGSLFLQTHSLLI